MTGAARALVHTIAARGVVTASSAVISVITARTLLAEGRGEYAVLIAIAWAGLVLGGLSAEQGQVVLWADAGLRPALTANALVLGILMGVLTAPAVGAAMLLSGWSASCAAVMLAAVPILIVWEYLCGIALLRDRARILNNGTMIGCLVWCASVMAAAMAGWLTAKVAFALWTAYELVTVVYFVHALRPRLRDFDHRLARRTVGVGLRYHLGLVSTQLLPRVDVLMVSAFSSTGQAGLYAVATTLADLARIPVEALVKVAMPRQVEGDHERAVEVTLRAVRAAFVMALVTAGGLCALASALVPLVYGDAFRGSVLPFLCLAPGIVSASVARPIWIFLLRLDRPWVVTSMSVGALVLDVTLNALLIPRWGATGCAAVTGVVLTVLAGTQCGWFLRATGTPARRLLPRWPEIAVALSAAARAAGDTPLAGRVLAGRRASRVREPDAHERSGSR
ncbi:oligosaccharide flippase family protein [Sphaerisporangium sp. NPDC051011]|uniref:lipopolysaccharide biosynthesis protein n=1 Tax=Sphaerisporangium sp. NPDC051011 TaxID=3155792 RepID=UPI0033E7E50D